jgi:hypothetical protein
VVECDGLDGITLLLVPSPEASHDAEHGGQRQGAHDDPAGADAHDEDDHRLVVQDLGRVVGVAVGGTALDAAQLVEVAGQRAGVDLLELLVAWVGFGQPLSQHALEWNKRNTHLLKRTVELVVALGDLVLLLAVEQLHTEISGTLLCACRVVSCRVSAETTFGKNGTM